MIKSTVALVTGGAGCLGSATAKKLVSLGCKVVLLDLPDSKGEEVAKSLGESAAFSPGDVTSDDDVVKALELTKSKFGSLRTLINCAGVHKAIELYNFNKDRPSQLEYHHNVFKVNVLGMLNVTRLALRYINENPPDPSDLRGLVINVSGFAAYDGQLGQTALAGAWGAIGSMTLPLCRELGDRGIRVMTIAPGLMDSRLVDFMPENIIRSLTLLTPSPKRLGYKEEFADLVVAIMENKFLNGEVIRLNGGLRLAL